MTMGCPTTFWTRIAVAALQGAAKSWWHSVALTAFPGEPLNTISWDNFRRVFVFRYLPPEAIKEKELEFLTQTQGKDKVAVYVNKFTELMIFAPHFVANEADRAYRFVDGLVVPARQRLFSLKLETLDDAIRAATRDERAYLTREKTYGGYSRNSSHSERRSGNEKGRSDKSVAVRALTGYETKTRENSPCHTCGQLGHWSRECPLKGQQPRNPQQQAPQQQPRQVTDAPCHSIYWNCELPGHLQ